jgi:hypothetical protein
MGFSKAARRQRQQMAAKSHEGSGHPSTLVQSDRCPINRQAIKSNPCVSTLMNADVNAATAA